MVLLPEKGSCFWKLGGCCSFRPRKGLFFWNQRDNWDQMKKQVEKFAKGKHKKVEQALGLSLRNLFEQLAWRIPPAAVRA